MSAPSPLHRVKSHQNRPNHVSKPVIKLGSAHGSASPLLRPTISQDVHSTHVRCIQQLFEGLNQRELKSLSLSDDVTFETLQTRREGKADVLLAWSSILEQMPPEAVFVMDSISPLPHGGWGQVQVMWHLELGVRPVPFSLSKGIYSLDSQGQILSVQESSEIPMQLGLPALSIASPLVKLASPLIPLLSNLPFVGGIAKSVSQETGESKTLSAPPLPPSSIPPPPPSSKSSRLVSPKTDLPPSAFLPSLSPLSSGSSLSPKSPSMIAPAAKKDSVTSDTNRQQGIKPAPSSGSSKKAEASEGNSSPLAFAAAFAWSLKEQVGVKPPSGSPMEEEAEEFEEKKSNRSNA